MDERTTLTDEEILSSDGQYRAVMDDDDADGTDAGSDSDTTDSDSDDTDA